METRKGLADFDVSRGEFETAFASIPDGALSYLKPGDDYSLGGLAVHVNWVLVHYRRVLEGIVEGGYAEFRAIDPEEELERTAERTRSGIAAGERRAELDLTADLHSRVKSRFESIDPADWERKAPVFYGAHAAEPFATSPADVAGWLSDHYREHVPQIAELVATWMQAR